MTGTCSRCGRVTELEYGSDGLGYCSSCVFYGMNKQCWRCRMYLPASELQQYNGQFTCPYCIQDLRDEARHNEYKPENHKLEILQYAEVCERCGRNLEDSRVYFWNGKRLCKKCLEHEQESWGLVGGGPMHSMQKTTIKPEEERKSKNLVERTIDEMLIFLRLKKKKKEVVIYEQKMPIQRAKPMAEQAMQSKKADRKPQSESIMKEDFFEKSELEKVPRRIEAQDKEQPVIVEEKKGEIELEREPKKKAKKPAKRPKVKKKQKTNGDDIESS